MEGLGYSPEVSRHESGAGIEFKLFTPLGIRFLVSGRTVNVVFGRGRLHLMAAGWPAYASALAAFPRGLDARGLPHQAPPRSSHIAMQTPREDRFVRGL